MMHCGDCIHYHDETCRVPLPLYAYDSDYSEECILDRWTYATRSADSCACYAVPPAPEDE